MKIHEYSLLRTLGIIIITLVVTIMLINSTYNYYKTKAYILQEMKKDSKKSMLSLKSNISLLLASYSPNEYEKIINNEIKDKDIFAIVIKDYNLGKVLGTNVYISGKIKDKNSVIFDYDFKNKEQNKKLTNSFFSTSSNITDSSNKLLGTVTIYLTNKALNEELDKVIYDSILNTLLLSVFLILILFITIKYYILKPISNIIDAINNNNEHGIPSKPIPYSKSTEINALSTSINKMIKSIKDSRNILEKSQHQLEYLLDLSPISIRITKSVQGKDYVVFSNKAYSKLLQLDKDNLYGMNPKEYYINKSTYENVKKALKDGNSIHNMMMDVKINNNLVWVLSSYMNIEYDGEKAIIGWFYDITKEKDNETNLHKALELQTTIFDNSGYLMISTNKDGIIQQFNKEAERLLGYKAEEVVNIHTPAIFHLKSELKQRQIYLSKELNIDIKSDFEVFTAKTDLGLKNESEWTYITKKGEHIPVLLTITSLKNKDNITYGYLGITQDISQRKLLESQSKLASMGEMIGNIAHQWRQPLNSIGLTIQDLLPAYRHNEINEEYLIESKDEIMEQLKYMSKTIDEFRNFFTKANKVTQFNIIDSLKEIISFYWAQLKESSVLIDIYIYKANKKYNIKELEEIDFKEYEIFTRISELKQLIINCISNAKDAIVNLEKKR
jgi:nitrogen fixation/metabolism regulation signal transduction histidine kinase